MHSEKFLANLLLLLLCLILHLSCEPNKISKRSLTVTGDALIAAANHAEVRCTPTVSSADFITLSSQIVSSFKEEGIDKFKIGTSGSKNLKMSLPAEEGKGDLKLVEDFVSFMMGKNMKVSKYAGPKNNSDNLHFHFQSSAVYCEHVLCSNQPHQSIIVNAYDLLVACLGHSAAVSDKSAFEQRIDGELASDSKVRDAILTKPRDHMEYLNFLVFIPRHQTALDFVGNCAKKAENEEQFMLAILNACESKQTTGNQKVHWDQIFAEMRCYSPTGNSKSFQKGVEAKSNFGELDKLIYLRVFKKFNVCIDNIIFSIHSENPIEIACNYIAEVEKVYKNSQKTKDFSEIERTIFYMSQCNHEMFQSLFNLSKIAAEKLRVVEITKAKFDEIIRKQFFPKPTIMLFDKSWQNGINEQSDLIMMEKEIKFSQFPYIEEENLNCAELLADYATFVGASVDSTKDYDQVLSEFWKKFHDKQSLVNYESHLMARPIKKSKDFANEISEEVHSEDDSQIVVSVAAHNSSDSETSFEMRPRIYFAILLSVSSGVLVIFSAIGLHAYRSRRGSKQKSTHY